MKKTTLLLSCISTSLLLLCSSCRTTNPAVNNSSTIPPAQHESTQTTQKLNSNLQFISSTKYSFGTLTAYINSNLFSCDKAIRSTCQRAKLTQLSRITKYQEVQYVFRDVRNVRLLIVIDKISNNQIKISIKVDKFGNEINSRELLQAIDDDLKYINTPSTSF
ncbi:MAG: DUF3568 family protein [Lentisphaeria bacterium]